jgi:hypothetical protein
MFLSDSDNKITFALSAYLLCMVCDLHHVVREISESKTSARTGISTGVGSKRPVSNGGSFIHGESLLTFVAGLGSGAALMYFLDPDRGRTRRALVGDQVTGLTNDAQDALGKKQRDLQNRAKGLWAETRKAVTGNAVAEGRNEPGNDPEIGRAASQR